jgi:MFS family permease
LASTPAAERRYQHLRLNFPLILTDYIVFGIAFALTSPSSVIPDFVNRLTANEVLVGLAGSINTLLWLAPQLLFAQVITRSTRRKPFLFTAVPARATTLLLALLIFTSNGDPTTILVGFFVYSFIFWIGDGMVTIAWADMLGSALPDKVRSTLYAFGQLGVAVGALLAREVVRTLLGAGGPEFPQNYGILFAVAGVIFIFGGVCLALLREEKSTEEIQPGPTLRQFLPYVGQVLRNDGRFRFFVIMRLFFDFSSMALPFYIILGTDVLRQDNSTLVGDSILLVTLGNAAFSVINGWLSRQRGPASVLRVMSLAKIGMPALALVSIATGTITGIHGAFVMLGAINGSFGPGYFDWVITHAPHDRRPIYIGLTNTISALGNLAPLVGGVILAEAKVLIAQPEGLAQGPAYAVLFGIALTTAVIGGLMSLRLSEPRLHTTRP